MNFALQIGFWSAFRATALPFPWLSAQHSIGGATRGKRIFGHFPDVDVIRVDWHTKPLQRQIPLPWLANKIHNWSTRKIAKSQVLPASRDLYKSSIRVTLAHNGFLEFRPVIQKCIPGAAQVAIKRPQTRVLRYFLRLLMRDSQQTRLECGFYSEGNLKICKVSSKSQYEGKLRRSCHIWAPYSSFQAILQKWEYQAEPTKDFRRANEFARDCLLWCAEQPQKQP